MAPSLLTYAIAGAMLATSVASAAPCEPAAQIVGEPALVATVGDLLARHGIAAESSGCPIVRVRLEHRGPEIMVIRVSNPEEERAVTEPATAATVIESWARSDFEKPLLTTPSVTALAAPAPAPSLMASSREAADTNAPYTPPRGVQVFAAVETSFTDDRTSWVGAVLGVCVQMGRMCASARGRVATVVDGPAMWSEAERHAADVLLGGDIPFRLGETIVSVGMAAGMGSVHTGSLASGMAQGSETFGLRGDAHVAWTIRLGRRMSLEISAALDVAQVTDVEGSLGPEAANEPRVFGRLGAGLRFGDL